MVEGAEGLARREKVEVQGLDLAAGGGVGHDDDVGDEAVANHGRPGRGAGDAGLEAGADLVAAHRGTRAFDAFRPWRGFSADVILCGS